MWLVSFALALTAALLCNLARLRHRKPLLAGAVVLLLAPWVLGQAFKGHNWTTPAGEPLNVAAVQGNIAQSIKWNPEAVDHQLQLYRDKTFVSKPVDLIVWPETAVPVLMDSAQGYLAMMGRFASDRHSALITGVPIRQVEDGQRRFYNGITVVGDGEGLYRKQKLVPFGEYVPLQDLLRGLIAFFDLPMSDFARGPADQPLLQAKGYQIAPFICYEVVYPELAVLPDGLAFRQPPSQRPCIVGTQKAHRCRHHLQPVLFEAPARALHVPGLSHHHHTLDAVLGK